MSILCCPRTFYVWFGYRTWISLCVYMKAPFCPLFLYPPPPPLVVWGGRMGRRKDTKLKSLVKWQRGGSVHPPFGGVAYTFLQRTSYVCVYLWITSTTIYNETWCRPRPFTKDGLPKMDTATAAHVGFPPVCNRSFLPYPVPLWYPPFSSSFPSWEWWGNWACVFQLRVHGTLIYIYICVYGGGKSKLPFG